MAGQMVGKVCVVTGAAKGIGLGIARRYCVAGAKVALIDVDARVKDEAEKLQAEGYTAEGYVLDVTDREAVFACFAEIEKVLGPVYALVNNAGIVDQRPFEEITPEQMDRVMRVNVNGTLYCTQAVAKTMKEQRAGRIINFSSKSGKTGSALMAHYSAAKGAIISLTHSLAFELAPFGINVNAICPGITADTGVWDEVSRGYVVNLKMPREDVVKKFTQKVPLGRLAQIDDIVDFVFFLTVSGAYCTGQAFNVDGGREVH